MKVQDKRLATARRLSATVAVLCGTAICCYGFTPDPRTQEPGIASQSLPRMRDAAAVARVIDQEIDQRLQVEKVPPSPQAADSEFCRRVHIDIIGRVPTLDETFAFLNSQQPDKRSKLIDDLLARREYGQHWATIWTNLSVGRTDAAPLAASFHRARFQDWLAESFNANTGWDNIVTELLTAEGPIPEVPAAAFLLSYSGNNLQPQPERIVGAVSELFLGIHLKCAECHNHRGPHAVSHWKHADFWAMAAFFSRLRNRSGNKGSDASARTILTEEDVPKGRALNDNTFMAPRPILPGGYLEVPDPADSSKFLPRPVKARFLEGKEPDLLPRGPYRPWFAAWLTSPRNPYFARALVNRLWAHFFGRGLVAPIDLMHMGNQASHPGLFQELTEEFVASGYDLKHLIRCMANSRAYQRTSSVLPGNAKDREWVSHMAVKPLRPEVLFDSLQVVTKGSGFGPPPAGAKSSGTAPREAFAQFFGNKEWSTDPTELIYGIPQYLRLMNVADGGPVLAKLAAQGDDSRKVIESLYLAALGRRPTAAEMTTMLDYLSQAADAKVAYSEISWVLLNSAEFVLNH
jgi:Protein of unknown function (DUF1549)/Protein of unknown function (DUF1553)